MGTRERISHLHSVTLDADACKGCTNCLKRCPTEAIRVRHRQAVITESRCVDCGECIRHCPYRAKKALTDSLDSLNHYTWCVALPAPSLYGQFEERHSIPDIHRALLKIGFHQVADVFEGANIAARATRDYLEKTSTANRPVISSSCPAVLRLIMVRFPSLLDNLAPILAPMEITARGIRKSLAALQQQNGQGARPGTRDRIGLFFISPCAGKMTDLHDPVGIDRSEVDGVIAFKDIYLSLRAALDTPTPTGPALPATAQPAMKGLAWGRVDGEGASIGVKNRISVDGIEHVIKILEMAENGSLGAIEFIEAMACPAGCVGGPLAVENPFIARVRLLNREAREECPPARLTGLTDTELTWTHQAQARSGLNLASTMSEALRRECELEQLAETLPGLDCGSCGAPTCRALAEDVVCFKAGLDDCLIKLRDQVKTGE